MLGKNTYFKVKFINLIVIAAILYIYNINLNLWETKEEMQAEQERAELATQKLTELETSLDSMLAEYTTQNQEAKKAEAAYLWQDGTYEGTGIGFAGELTVSVTIEKDTIVDIQLVDSGNDDAAYVNMAVGVIDKMLDEQTWDVDAVSGATFSSNGIRDAVAEALSLAENAAQSQEVEVAEETEEEEAEEEEAEETYLWQDGTYEGTGTGFAGELTVSVTIEKGTITDIQLVDSGNDDAAYVNMAVGVIDKMLDEQTWDVDAVSGATFSSNGIRDAVAEALSLAENP